MVFLSIKSSPNLLFSVLCLTGDQSHPVCTTINKPSCVLHLLDWLIGSRGFSSLERRPEFWVLHQNSICYMNPMYISFDPWSIWYWWLFPLSWTFLSFMIPFCSLLIFLCFLWLPSQPINLYFLSTSECRCFSDFHVPFLLSSPSIQALWMTSLGSRI